jgi:hypothetical protein
VAVGLCLFLFFLIIFLFCVAVKDFE